MNQIINEISTGHTSIKLRSDGLIIVHSSNDYHYDVKDIKENHEAIKKLANGKKALVLTFSGEHSNITKEALDYIAKGPHISFVKAEAFIIHSLAHRLLARFYVVIKKTVVPANYFTDEAKAIKWLESFE